jgi:hypothetical protein
MIGTRLQNGRGFGWLMRGRSNDVMVLLPGSQVNNLTAATGSEAAVAVAGVVVVSVAVSGDDDDDDDAV